MTHVDVRIGHDSYNNVVSIMFCDPRGDVHGRIWVPTTLNPKNPWDLPWLVAVWRKYK